MNAIETRGLTRLYGKLAAVQDLNLVVPQGSLYGLIGPNGAGKTTTLRMLAGLLEPTSGEIVINGQPIQQNMTELRRQIGYMPDFFGVYEDLLVWEYLDFFARCYDTPTARRRTIINELLELVDLTEKRDSYVHTLSRGMRQRLCLAHAMVHDPQVLLLDEPASGLDPRARVEMRELLRELGAMGKTVVLSSHILSELAELCDSIGIIERGRLVTSGLLSDIRVQLEGGRRIAIRLLSDLDTALKVLSEQPGVGQIDVVPTNGNNNGSQSTGGTDSADETDNNGEMSNVGSILRSSGVTEIEVEFVGDENAVANLLENLVAQRVRMASFNEMHTGLEEVFLRLTKGEVA